MPWAVLYIPTVDLVRLQGRITDSGNIIVNSSRTVQSREGGLVLRIKRQRSKRFRTHRKDHG